MLVVRPQPRGPKGHRFHLWQCQCSKLVGWLVDFTALVEGTNNKDTHILRVQQFNVALISLMWTYATCRVGTKVVIVKIGIFKDICLNHSANKVFRAMRGESKVTNLASRHVLLDHVNAVSILSIVENPIILVLHIDTVNTKEVDIVQLKETKGCFQCFTKLLCRSKGSNLGLDNQIFALHNTTIKQLFKGSPELQLRGSIHARCFNVVHTKITNGSLENANQIVLTIAVHHVHVLHTGAPFLLKAHAPESENRHLETRFAKADLGDLDIATAQQRAFLYQLL
mmetsp:Transcript_28242/g.46776  ORF Transcript_28242/g.46776 Transcript_28242/m.46776 type:complete len:283 (-) Transcript_28242:319-1167(-)